MRSLRHKKVQLVGQQKTCDGLFLVQVCPSISLLEDAVFLNLN